MKQILCAAVLAAACLASHAQTLRWASQGDPQTMDPHSQNESMTNMMNGQVYERLTSRDRSLKIVPGLATSWEQVSPLLWRFKLRPNVKFHDGSPFTADDVVFSIERGQQPTSQINNYVGSVGTPRKVDDMTVEFQLAAVNPIFLEHLDSAWMMSKAWAEKNRVVKPLDFKNKEESHASQNANGTGPYMLVSRAPGIKTTYKRNPAWWGKHEGNVQDIVFADRQRCDAAGGAGLGRGGFRARPGPARRAAPAQYRRREDRRRPGEPGRADRHGPGPRRVAVQQREGQEPVQGSAGAPGAVPRDRYPDLEDQADERAKRPHRRADALAGRRVRRPRTGEAPAVRPGRRAPADGRGRLRGRLRGDARLPEQPLCQRRVDLRRAGRHVGADQGPRQGQWHAARDLFPQVEKYDFSMYMLGWGGAVTDAETTLTPVLRNAGEKGVGFYTSGKAKNDKADAIAAQSSTEADPVKRRELVKAALRDYREQIAVIPLHRQVIPWAARSNVNVVHRPDNWFELHWVTVDK